MARIIRAGDITSINESRGVVSSIPQVQTVQAPQQTPNHQSQAASVLSKKHLDVASFETALKQMHQNMPAITSPPTQMIYEDKGRYVGTIVNGKREGFGEYFFANGDYYKGLWMADSMSGIGYYRYASSERAYYGQFLNGKNHGYGTLTIDKNPPIIIYDGHWFDGVKNGQGIYVYSYEPLEFYQGNWAQGQKTGHGKYFKDGNEYQGEWLANRRNGQGDYQTKEGVRYSGKWKNDALEEATVVYPKGSGIDEYRGQINRGLRNGRGVYTYAEGGRYEGTYKDDMRQGRGKEVAGTAIYEGQFNNDKKHGRGMYRYSNGDTYEGTFQEGKKQGSTGLYTWADKSTFQGIFRDDRMWEGTYVDSADKVQRKVISGNIQQ